MNEIGSLDRSGKFSELKVPQFIVNDRAIGAVAIELQGKSYLPTTDLFYNVVQLIDPETEKVLESYQYSAFGDESIFDGEGNSIPTTLVNNPWRYRGERKDAVTNLIQMGHRDYDPKTCRFTTCDPLSYFDGPNLYAYAHNNPLRYSDPTGLTAESNTVNTDYFYGNYEVHCYCERHRTCKRGGAIASVLKGIAHGAIDFGVRTFHGFQSLVFYIGTSNERLSPLERDLIIEALELSQAKNEAFLEGKIHDYLAIDLSNIHYQAFRATTSFSLEVVPLLVAGAYGAKKVATSLSRMVKTGTEITDEWAYLSGVLRQASKGKGNFGIGMATQEQATAMGYAWVGKGYKISRDGTALISANGMRQYRPPTFKKKLGKKQANFQRKFDGQISNGWQSNGHLDILNTPEGL